jgi:hypothetical protein
MLCAQQPQAEVGPERGREQRAAELGEDRPGGDEQPDADRVQAVIFAYETGLVRPGVV